MIALSDSLQKVDTQFRLDVRNNMVTILQAAAALRAKQLSSVELTDEALTRIARLNPKLNAFITVLDDEARARARKADAEIAAGVDLGPLHGVPIAVKDVFATKGHRTTAGSKLFFNNITDYDAAAVEKLVKAGAVIVGKTNMDELALGITSNNPYFGAVRNPWDTERIPGGSSGGSASAVAAHLVFMAIGSDTGGSVRIPAAFCGTVGIKPTFGRISRYGVLPLDFSLDHVGILTRSVRDAAVVLNLLAGYDTRDDSSSRQPVKRYVPGAVAKIDGLRIGLPDDLKGECIDAEIRAAIHRAAHLAENLGAVVVPIQVPDIVALNAAHRVILHSEASALMKPFLSQRNKISSALLGLLQQGLLLSATDYVNAQRFRRVAMEEFAQVFLRVDCLIGPTTAIPAPRIGQTEASFDGEIEDVRLATTRLARSANFLGLPAISVPCGFTQQGLPIGLQITGRPFEEDLILRVGAALEDASNYSGGVPAIASVPDLERASNIRRA